MDDATQIRHLGLESLTGHEFEERTNDTFVSDDKRRPGAACVQMAETPFDSTPKNRTDLAGRKLEIRLLGLPVRKETGIDLLDFFASQSFPTTEMDLTKTGFDSNAMTRRNDLCGFPCAMKRACPDRFEGFPGNATAGFAGLSSSEVGERYIGCSVVANARLAEGLSMTNENEASQSI